MSYYPILKAPGVQGWTTLCNFPPNNWESGRCRSQRINVTWRTDDGWRTQTLGDLAPGSARTIRAADVAEIVPEEALALLSLSDSVPHSPGPVLPGLGSGKTRVPVWRATLGLSSPLAQTSYQGEIDPFPPQGTLLTFAPFLQFGADVENYLLFMNIESAPITRQADLELYTADAMELRGKVPVRSNQINVIPLDGFKFGATDLPTFICRRMAGIPLYFSRTRGNGHMSLEHTHPPASLAVHGKRWEAQRLVKECWFKRLAQ